MRKQASVVPLYTGASLLSGGDFHKHTQKELSQHNAKCWRKVNFLIPHQGDRKVTCTVTLLYIYINLGFRIRGSIRRVLRELSDLDVLGDMEVVVPVCCGRGNHLRQTNFPWTGSSSPVL